ncbi:MAG: transposase, partial [Kiritimatiellae bacterium]|nr:transposase [Kiritimatiellia bacterium]
MARTARVKSTADGTAYYHLTSRACNRQFLFRKTKVKTRLAELIRIAAEFSGVVLEAFTVMDNHIHVLCKIVRGGVVTQEEVVRRVALLKGAKAAEELSRRWDALAASGLGEELE